MKFSMYKAVTFICHGLISKNTGMFTEITLRQPEVFLLIACGRMSCRTIGE